MKKTEFVILAAGKPKNGNMPVLFTDVNGKTLFDWQTQALSGLDLAKPQIVVGYASDEYNKLSKRAIIQNNNRWKETGSAYSFLNANLNSDSIIVSYADILYRPKIIQQLNNSSSDMTVVYDSLWKQRYSGRPRHDINNTEKVIISDSSLLKAGQNIEADWANGEFIGLIHFQNKAIKFLHELQDKKNINFEKLTLSELVEWLRLQGLSSSVIDVEGDWAELNEPKDLAHFILGTKAETLDRLSKMVSQSIILDQVAFTVDDWNKDKSKIIKKISTSFSSSNVVVRSSAKSEDSFSYSNAGAYESVLNVDTKDGLEDAIISVINSYKNCQLDDQILVQPMLKNIKLCGVAFTCSLEEGAPFYVINYDESGGTEGITSGTARNHKSTYLRKDVELENIPDNSLLGVLKAIQEVETILSYDALDIEFALDNDGNVFLLQVRPITTIGNNISNEISEKILKLQINASKYWTSLQAPSPQIQGDKAIFGVMPDWNPAEIIGTNPGKLAVSLYEYLILNDTWAIQRSEYGYRNVSPQPLLRNFSGKPYIDIRASFNSFIPKDLSDELTNKLVNFYLSWLEEHPYLHDKVEFDVVPTCYGPMFSKWEDRLFKKANLTNEEINKLKSGLLKITKNALKRNKDDFKNLDILQKLNKNILNDIDLSNSEKVRLLLENCKTYGTLPFAHLARSGFIAVTLLKEGVDAGWLSEEAKEGFMESIHTVSHELGMDAWKVKMGKLDFDNFVLKYGHLRPGTYDISSSSYADDPEQFLKPLVESANKPLTYTKKVDIWQNQKEYFFRKLRSIGLDVDDTFFEAFLKDAIEGREKAKFIFSRSLSESLNIIIKEGTALNLTVDQLSNIPLSDLTAAFNSNTSNDELSKHLSNLSKQNTYERKISHACKLPPLICNLNDFKAFTITEEKPNYIGTSRITAQVIHLDGGNREDSTFENCIVMIPQADPGYDWLFGQKIAGLITMYGGANSHMAIRAAEFGLPAAIGIGEQLYRNLSNARIIELDPAGETIRKIQ